MVSRRPRRLAEHSCLDAATGSERREVIIMAFKLKEPEATCKDCGITFTRKSPRSVRCRKCQEQYRAEQVRANARAHYARLHGSAGEPRNAQEAPEDSRESVKSSLCDTKTCARCIYSFSLSGTLACDYILATGHRRGCPAGAGCDKRQTGKRKKKAMRI